MFYLRHYFNPDFNHTKLMPTAATDGTVDYRYLGYVQNVVKGQALAELVELENIPENARDPRFIYTEEYLPVGPNCELSSSSPRRILAAENGYCFYYQGLITVKKLLNVRGNVGFNTGNIFYINDIAVHGDVQTGFALWAKNVLVKGHIESAKVKAVGDIACLQGVKGTNDFFESDSTHEEAELDGAIEEAKNITVPNALLDAGGNIRLPFCEHVQLRAKGNIIIDGACMHSSLYVGGNLVVRGRLQGGSVCANSNIYVEKQLGSEYMAPTKLLLGYDPFNFLALQKLEKRIGYLRDKTEYFQNMAKRNSVMEQEYLARHQLAQYKLCLALKKRTVLWQKFIADEEKARQCRVIVPGKIYPGCEISIAKSYLLTQTEAFNVVFFLDQDEVVMKPLDEMK